MSSATEVKSTTTSTKPDLNAPTTENQNRVILAAVKWAKGGGASIQGSRIHTNEATGVRTIRFYTGPCKNLYLLEQNPANDSWSAKWVQAGYNLFWILNYEKTDQNCDQCTEGKILIKENWRDCLNCRGTQKVHTGAFTGYLVLAQPGLDGKVRIMPTNQLKGTKIPTTTIS